MENLTLMHRHHSFLQNVLSGEEQGEMVVFTDYKMKSCRFEDDYEDDI